MEMYKIQKPKPDNKAKVQKMWMQKSELQIQTCPII